MFVEGGIVYRVVYFVISYLLICFGIALSNRCGLPIIPTDLFPRELADITKIKYYKIKIGFYVTAINETIKKECDAPTIGLLLCRGKNRVTVDWSLKSTNVPIGVSTYKLKEQLPKELIDKLPTEEEINLYLNVEEGED